MFTALRDLFVTYSPLSYWIAALVLSTFVFALWRGFFKARKIQPKGFNWIIFRNEFFFAVITLVVSATVLGYISKFLTTHGFITFNKEPTTWWVIAIEYVAYFLLFDTWFYWFHRLMHVEPMYKWVHKLHHYSTAPNLLTTLSVSPIESLVNGGFVPVFTSLLTIHPQTMLLIGPTTMFMGFYVHSGYEFLPRWWNKTWVTKWFITTTFHDQHHKYFRWNFGGYTTIWDAICGTTRARYEQDFEQLKARASNPLSASPVAAAQTAQPEG